jgi:hypothetical protein
MLTAKELHQNGRYSLAFSMYSRVLALQIAHGGNNDNPQVLRTIGHIIWLLFDQHPDLSDCEEAKDSPYGCQVTAFTKLPLGGEETRDVGHLFALRAIADWYASGASRKGGSCFFTEDERYRRADELYAQYSSS